MAWHFVVLGLVVKRPTGAKVLVIPAPSDIRGVVKVVERLWYDVVNFPAAHTLLSSGACPVAPREPGRCRARENGVGVYVGRS